MCVVSGKGGGVSLNPYSVVRSFKGKHELREIRILYSAMEFRFSSSPMVLSLIIIISISLILKLRKRLIKTNRKASSKNLPPGPWKLPIFGSLHHLLGGLPHRRLTELSKKHGSLMHIQLGETSVIVISSPEISKQILKTHDTAFAQRPQIVAAEAVTYGYITFTLSPYGDYWKRIRRICTQELLSAKRVRSFQSIRNEEVSRLVRSVSRNIGSVINLSDTLLNMTYSITAKATLGSKSGDQEAFISYMKRILRTNENFNVSNIFPSQKWLHRINGAMRELEDMHRTSDRILDDIIAAAKSKTGNADGTLLSFLLSLEADNCTPEFQFSRNNVKALLQDMLLAGSETSSSTMEWVFSEMLKNPRVLKKAQAEIREVFGNKGYVDENDLGELQFLKAIIKESMRLHPPGGALLPRECRETCEINGYTIPAGTQVLVNSWAIGRDPKYWNEAEKFYPERFLDSEIDYKGSHFEFIPFGAGKRMCPGMLFALPNIELPLAQLLYYFDWDLPFGVSHENLDMIEDFGITMRRKNDLFVVPISHHHLPFE
ncbi:cytochrome P450 71D11 [Arachis ipaensis]|uniref:cytochrome P450 71D11 n=1 Tax=Arachis ipaensis TaxID=130454 RepID=UPI0007AF00EA|nr:cytochrome P450 71D11 [Arachis ipaensis]